MSENLTFYPIDGYGNYFLGKGEGDNDWSVWSNYNGELKELKGGISKRGHIRYALHTDDGKQVTKALHVLIAEIFLPIPKELLESGESLDIHHINENKLDNRIENLCWLTHSEHQRLHKKGEKHPFYGKHHSEWHKRNISESLTNNPLISKEVYQYTLDGELVKIWESTQECGRNGYNFGGVAECCRGERKQHKGFKWSYEPLP